MEKHIELLPLTQSAESRRHESVSKLQNFFIALTTGFVIVNIQLISFVNFSYLLEISVFASLILSAINVVLIIINILLEINYYDKITNSLSKLMNGEIKYNEDLFKDSKQKYTGWINYAIIFFLALQIIYAIFAAYCIVIL